MTITVGIVMGSQTDLEKMQKAADILTELGVEWEMSILSAHRTPHQAIDYSTSARDRGLKVLIAGAGGAAHLPGVLAGLTTLPVIGVPLKASNSIDGWDSVLSILQMPSGVPVATVALDGTTNAGILAAQIVGTSDAAVAENLARYKRTMAEKVLAANAAIQKK